MKYVILVSTLVALLFFGCGKKIVEEVNIIPKPNKIEYGQGRFLFNTHTKILIDDNEDVNRIASFFGDQIRANTVLDPEIRLMNNTQDLHNKVIFRLETNKDELGEEGYKLVVDRDKINLLANTPKGLFWGIQTLLQLFPLSVYEKKQLSEIEIPCVAIIDKPRFNYRGMHLDVCRHMFPVDFIKRYIDLLAFYKFNTFHWHLTEDQGWRVEIKKYPELTKTGAWRKETLIGHGGNKPFEYDGEPYGGFYTQEEIRAIVDYAAKRQITIIPEIEMPGHSLAALASYPQLACTPGPFEVATRWGVFNDIYCTKEETFEFLENVLLEVMGMFPSKYIHIGGDEAPKARWKKCQTCQATIKREGLKDEHELQSYFIRRMEKFLNSHGRSIIGWDEILEGGLAPNATVMSWRGTEGGIAAAQQGHNAIMTPGSHCYFDHYQANPEFQPLAIGGYTPLKKVYHYEPIPEELSSAVAQYILGAQANVWTEYIASPEEVEYMILPRMAALAEVNWAQLETKNWPDFQRRINHHYKYYDAKAYNYCPGSFVVEIVNEKNTVGDKFSVSLLSEIYKTEIRYTLDGTMPENTSLKYDGVFIVPSGTIIKAAVFVEGEIKENPSELVVK